MIPLSLPRRLVWDLVHFGKKVPAVTVQRKMKIARLVKIRAGLDSRPSWCVLFTRAFALAARTCPQLRRCFVRWPWPRLYEHPESIASIALERDYQGEPAVFFAKIRNPENHSIAALEEHLHRFKNEPLPSISCFRRALLVGRFPQPLRRFLWWITLNWAGFKRAKRLGTFGVSVYSSLGAASLNPISPLTAALNYDVIQEDGSVDVRIVYDHRVMDGGTVARALAEMERLLNEDLADELTSLQREQNSNPNGPAAGALVA